MTQELFRIDAYLQECEATVIAVTESGLILDRTVFYPLGGGQSGDKGWLTVTSGAVAGQRLQIKDTRKAKDAAGINTAAICHVLSEESAVRTGQLQPGDRISAKIDWDCRHRLMRFHTSTHLLCHVIPQLVNGCSITPAYARLDFNMTEPLDKEELSNAIAILVAGAHPVNVGSITDAELDANSTLVKSMSVAPPRGSGQIRTIRIGTELNLIDLQPCGGTHVRNTAEIGNVVVTKIEKKSATTRRVVLGFA